MFLELHGENLPVVKLVKEENMERLIRESTFYRKNIRGEAIGRLG